MNYKKAIYYYATVSHPAYMWYVEQEDSIFRVTAIDPVSRTEYVDSITEINQKDWKADTVFIRKHIDDMSLELTRILNCN